MCYRDDKRRKAFKRGGPQKPKEPPQYEVDLLKNFHAEARRRFDESEDQASESLSELNCN